MSKSLTTLTNCSSLCHACWLLRVNINCSYPFCPGSVYLFFYKSNCVLLVKFSLWIQECVRDVSIPYEPVWAPYHKYTSIFLSPNKKQSSRKVGIYTSQLLLTGGHLESRFVPLGTVSPFWIQNYNNCFTEQVECHIVKVVYGILFLRHK